MAKQNVSSGSPPLLWSAVDQAFRNINDNFNELYASLDPIGGPVDFTNLGSDLNPVTTEFYDLGSPAKKWKTLHVSASEGVYIGNAQITATGSAVNLPAGSTIDGSLLDNEYFREIAVAGQTNLIADAGGNAVLTVAAGNSPGISLTTNPATDTLTITNSGVTQLAGTVGQIAVSAATGAVTLTNLGVLSVSGIGVKDPTLAAGSGIHVSSGTGTVTITNTGILSVGTYTGSGILINTISPGVVELVNGSPNIPQSVIRNISVTGQDTIISNSTAYTLDVASGSGITLTTNAGLGRLTVTNSGVTGITTSGQGISASSSTGNINIAFSNEIDIIGSVFADSSAMIIDGTEGKVVGPVYTSVLRTSEGSIALGSTAGQTNQGINNIAIGSAAGQTDQGISAVAIGGQAGQTNQGVSSVAIGTQAGATNQGVSAVAVGTLAATTGQGLGAVAVGVSAGQTNQGTNAVALGYLAGNTNQPAGSIVINASGSILNGSAAGLFVDPVRSLTNPATVLGYNSSTKEISYSSLIDVDVIGSVFSDNSTMLIDGTGGKIVGPVDTPILRTSETKIALGLSTGVGQGANAIAIGEQAGETTQGNRALAIGFQAAYVNQGVRGIAIGQAAANSNQGANGIAIGETAASANQGTDAIAIGQNAAQVSQGNEAIAIGYHASGDNQGTRAIAIGRYAAADNQSANSIVINATGTEITTGSSGFYIDPIRNLSTGNILTYNVTTKEIGYTSLIETDISGSVFADDSTKIIDGTDATVTATTVTAGGVIGTNYLRAPVYTNATARDTALPLGVVQIGMIIFLQSTSKLQVNANGTTGGWVDLN